MVLLFITFAISVGAWDTWVQYVVIPFPIASGVFVTLLPINSTHATLMAGAFLALLAYDVYKSTRIKDLLIRFEPSLILRFTTGGLMLLFSIYAGLLVILGTTGKEPLNIGKEISNTFGDNLDKAIQGQIQNSVQELPNDYLTQLDPSLAGMLQQFGLPTDLKDSSFLEPENLGINSKEIIETQVNTIVEPYKDLINPLMAILMFGIFQFYGAITALIFYILVKPVFWFAKKTGFLKVENITVQKELLKF